MADAAGYGPRGGGPLVMGVVVSGVLALGKSSGASALWIVATGGMAGAVAYVIVCVLLWWASRRRTVS